MKMPDRDIWIIWYSLVAFGVVASLALSSFAGIRFVYSIWFTVPAFFVGGNLLFARLMRSTEKEVERQTTPTATKDVPGLGTMIQFPERWECSLEVSLDGEQVVPLRVIFEAESDAPSARQEELAREFVAKYGQHRDEYLARLRDYFTAGGAPQTFDEVRINDPSIHISADGEPEDIEICFETEGEYSDMAYSIVLKEWKVVDVYGAD